MFLTDATEPLNSISLSVQGNKRSNDLTVQEPVIDTNLLVSSNLGNTSDRLEEFGILEDYDGNQYKTISLVGIEWMAENLNLKVAISICYDNSNENCLDYGRLYTYESGQRACLELGNGWRLPTIEEWDSLATEFGGYYDYSGARMRNSFEIKNSLRGYKRLVKGGDSGFNATFGGFFIGDNYHNLGESGGYLTSRTFLKDKGKSYSSWHVLCYKFSSDGKLIRDKVQIKKGDRLYKKFMSCRCVKTLLN